MSAMSPLDTQEISAKRYKSSLRVAMLTNFADMTGFGLLLPILPFVYKTLPISPGNDAVPSSFFYGMITSAFSGGQFVGGFLFGYLSDRLGRRPMLMLGLLGTAVFFVLAGLADDIVKLVLFRALGGLFAGTGGVCASTVADMTTPAERPIYMAMLGGAQGAGVVLGPVIGGGVAAIFGDDIDKGFKAASFGAAALCVVNLTLAFFFFSESPVYIKKRAIRKARREREAASASVNYEGDAERKLLLGEMEEEPTERKESTLAALLQLDLMLLCLVTFFFNTVFVANETALPLLAKNKFHFESKYVGPVFAVYGILLIITQVVIFSRLSRRFGLRIFTLVAPIMAGVFVFLVPLGRNLGETFSAVAGLAIVQGLGYPAFQVVASMMSKDNQGSVLGLRSSFAAGARIAGPLAAGWLYEVEIAGFMDNVPHVLPFFFTGTCCGLLAFLFSCAMKRYEVGFAAAVMAKGERVDRDAGDADETTSLLAPNKRAEP